MNVEPILPKEWEFWQLTDKYKTTNSESGKGL